MLVAFFSIGICFLLAAAAAGALHAVLDLDRGRWLALHLAMVGGVSMLVLGAAQFFVGAFLATGPPPRRLIRAQIGLWSTGTLAIALAVPLGADLLAVAGAFALLSALALFAAGLTHMRRISLQTARWAPRWYLAAAGFLAVGIVAGALLTLGVPWASGDLLSSHLALNLGGWLGCAIVGTLHTFYPSLTQTRLAFPRLEPPTFIAWTLGIGALALGYGLAVTALIAAGWTALLLAGTLLLANVATCARRGSPAPLPAQLIGAAQLLMIAGLLVALIGTATSPGALLIGSERAAAGILLLAGWIGLTVLGSLMHLLAVLRQIRSLPRPAAPRRHAADRYLAAVAISSVAGLAAASLSGLTILAAVAGVALLAVYASIGARAVCLAIEVLRAAPLRV